MKLNSLFHCEQTTKKKRFLLDGGATELYIMSKSRVNDIPEYLLRKNFLFFVSNAGEKQKTPLEEGKFGFLVFFIR